MENMLGNFLKEKQGKRSLREFAKKLDISHTYLDNLEKGYDGRTKKPVRVTVDTLSKIAKALDEPLDKLVAYSKNEDYNPVDITKVQFANAGGLDITDLDEDDLKELQRQIDYIKKMKRSNNHD